MIPYYDTDEFDRYYAALVLPFLPGSLEPDLEAFRRLVRCLTTDAAFVTGRGALLVNPEAGEVFYMTPEERADTIGIVLEERPAGMPVFAGVYGLRIEDVIASVAQAEALGVDGIFVMPPAGTMEVSTAIDGSRNPEIWTDFVRSIAESTKLPLIVHASHPFTAQWGAGLPIETVRSVVESVPSVVGWKMIYALDKPHFLIAEYLRSLPRHVGILNTARNAVHDSLLRGVVDGGVQGVLNFLHEPQFAHRAAWAAGDMAAVKKIYTEQIMPVTKSVYEDTSRLHIRYKLATWIRGRVAHPFMRPPMPPPRHEEAVALYDVMDKAGLAAISRDVIDETLTAK